MVLQAEKSKSKMMYDVVSKSINSIGITDLQGKLIYVNDACVKTWGYNNEDEMIGRFLPEFWEGDNIFLTIKELQEKGIASGEDTGKKKDGTVFIVQYSARILLDEAGNPAYMFGSFFDITDRKNAEESLQELTGELKQKTVSLEESNKALKESEEKFRLIANKSSDMIHVNDLEGNLLYVNPATELLLGHSVEKMLNKHATEFVHPDDREIVREEMQNKIAGRESDGPKEIRLLKADGTYLDVEVNGFVIKLSDGKKQLGAVIRDITFRKLADEALNNAYKDLEKEFNERTEDLSRSEELYRTLFENATDVIQIVRPDGQFLDVNSSWCNSLGYSLEEALNLNVFDIIDPECGGECEENFNRALTEGSTGIIGTTFRNKEGGKVILQGSANCIYKNGEPSYVHCIFHDITEKLRREDELIKMDKLESIGILAGGIAHDFNNILTALTGNLSLARMYVEPGGKVHKRIEQAEKASVRARDLTQQLLTFSEGGKPIKQLASISELVKDSSQFVLRGSNVKCDFDLPADLWLVELDVGQISQVINNLLINAGQAMPDGGTIKIYVENVQIDSNEIPTLKKGDYVMVSVKDQGSGISEKYLTKIFDPYFSTKHKGHGLGLATAYSIVNNHNGFLDFDSKLGKGSIFRFYLPASPNKKLHLAPGGQDIHIGKGFVLLMDDEEEIREIGREILEHMGYKVQTALDGRQTIKLYRKAMQDNTPFDFVIMDLTVPGGMGGKETIKELLELDPSATVIVSSGYANDTIMSDYKQYGFSGMVPKPYKIEEVSEILKLCSS